ncbi:MAG: lysylphosphatidylglycerol synthase domain-containing protein [Alphaproteobacteria bacterium]|nr:lysylphosphatidylglycerol synthase domain-containing protein [Alphaproteobacteria bacterium]
MTASEKIRIGTALFFGILLIAALFILQSIRMEDLASLNIVWAPTAGMVLCSLLYVCSGAWKWQLISKQWYGTAPDFSFHFTQTARAMLLAQFLPLSIAITAQRAAIMRVSQKIPVAQGAIHAAYDLGFDFLIAVLLVPATLLQLRYDLNFTQWLVIGICGLILCLILIRSGDYLFQIIGKVAPKNLNTNIEAWRAHGLFSKRFMVLMLALSAARFGIAILRLCLGAAALGLIIPWDAIAYTTPLATLPSLIPITPANLGIAEWSWAYLLSLWQMPIATGALYATGFRLLTLAVQGAIALLTIRR